MFGLIAATGIRVSEAIAIRLPDVTDDGLIIAETKFKKSRMLPLHPTTRRALDGYLGTRLKAASQSDALFISHQGTPLAYPTVISVFLQIMRSIGLRGAQGSRGPRIRRPLSRTLCARFPGGGAACHRPPVNAGADGAYVDSRRDIASRSDGMTQLAQHLTAFLREHLPRERRASVHTCDAYAYSFQLLVAFAARRLSKRPCLLQIEDIDVPMILAFSNTSKRRVATRPVRATPGCREVFLPLSRAPCTRSAGSGPSGACHADEQD